MVSRLLVCVLTVVISAAAWQEDEWQEDSQSQPGVIEATETFKAAGCMTSKHVAKAWVKAATKYGPQFKGSFTAKSLCVAALVVAHGESYDTKRCPKHLDSRAVGGGGKVHGLWQFSKDLFYHGMSAEKQAEVVLKKYSSNDQGYGCKASWSKCTAISIPGNSCSNSNVFCRRVWTGENEVHPKHYTKWLAKHFGIEEACSAATGGGSSPAPPSGPPPSPAPGPPAGSQCLPGMKAFKDTPSAGKCSCGKDWAEANNGGKGGSPCGGSSPPAPPSPTDDAPSCKNPKLKPFNNTPTAGKCSCGKNWVHANKKGKGGPPCVYGSGAAKGSPPPSPPANGGRKRGRGGRRKRG